MKNAILLLSLVCSLNAFGQGRIKTEYVEIEQEITGSDAPQGIDNKTFFLGNSFEYAVYEFSNILREGMNNKKEQQRIENARQQSMAKLNILKNQYAEFTSYPDSIAEGWHSAIVTDNLNFCKDVKVYVKKNKVRKLVLDNYIPLNCKSSGSIKKAKSTVTLSDFNGEQLNVLEVYFMYDIEEQNIVDEPMKAGYVCFYTDLSNYEEIQLKMNGQKMEKFTTNIDAENPECFSNGMVCRILKPGVYSYSAVGKGTIDWEGTFEIKAGYCLKLNLTSKWK